MWDCAVLTVTFGGGDRDKHLRKRLFDFQRSTLVGAIEAPHLLIFIESTALARVRS
jgi:hypothetical protein